MAHCRDEFILQPIDAPALADVDDDTEHEKAVAGLDRIEPELDRKFRCVATQPEQFAARPQAPRLRVEREGGALLEIFAAQPLRHQHLHSPADEFLAVVAE